jgi:hypothetical protein
MRLNDLTSLELIKLLESATELFRVKMYKSKEFVRDFLGLNIARAGFYGRMLGEEIIPLESNETDFNEIDDVTILVDGIKVLDKAPNNSGSGSIVYVGYGLLEVNGAVIYDGRNSAGSGSVISQDYPVVLSSGRSVGQFVNGDIMPTTGLNLDQFVQLIATETLAPAFTTFNLDQSSPIEVGTTIDGSRLFTWDTINQSNIESGTVNIQDITNGSTIGSALAPSGSLSANIGSITKVAPNSHIWRISLTSTDGDIITRDFNVNWSFLQFFGPASAFPTDSAEVRSLGSNRFSNSGNTFILNTGSTERRFVIAVPDGRTIASVIDLDALNQVITSQYVDRGTVTVQLPGVTTQSYRIFAMEQAIPYSTSHRHSVILNN